MKKDLQRLIFFSWSAGSAIEGSVKARLRLVLESHKHNQPKSDLRQAASRCTILCGEVASEFNGEGFIWDGNQVHHLRPELVYGVNVGSAKIVLVPVIVSA